MDKNQNNPNEPPKKNPVSDNIGQQVHDEVRNLEAAAILLLTNYKLSFDEKKEIINLIRLKFVSHTTLIEAVREPVLEPFKDMILEAISAKLSAYENTNTNYSISLQPRDCYADEKLKTVGNFKNLIKTSQLEAQRYPNDRLVKTETNGLKNDQFFQSNFKEDGYKEINTVNNVNFLDNSLRPEKSIAKFECHNKNIDIQLCISGNETFGWKSRNHCTKLKEEYNPDKDVSFYEDAPDMFFQLTNGQFVILFPEDVHAPMIAVNDNSIKKLVMKVRI
jgi:YhcH/YjgK/YiaL family protein